MIEAADDIERERLAQRILTFLREGPPDTPAVADAVGLDMAETRVALDRLAASYRVAMLVSHGHEDPRWLLTQNP